METHAPSLGDKIAHLRRSAQAQEKCAWIPSAIHALIMAALARIFGRLEQMCQLWQAGTLAPPPIRRPAARPRTVPGRPIPHRSARRTRRRAPKIRPRATRPAAPRPHNAVPRPTGAPVAVRHRSRPPRAPPAKNAIWQRRAVTSILLRYQNNQPTP